MDVSEDLIEILSSENKLIELNTNIRTIFVGDTHGDIETTMKVIKNYPLEHNRLVFLGDYVDRGNESKENIDYLLGLKLRYKDRILLLMGNHEAYPVIECSPSNFWDSLMFDEVKEYSELLLKLPLVVSIGNVLAVHGALPDVNNLEEINNIQISYNDTLLNFLWGDFVEKDGEYLGTDHLNRPQFGRGYFEKLIGKFNKKVLVRGHDPKANLMMFNNRCLTIFTSRYYGVEKKVAILEKNKNPQTTDDLRIESL